MSRPHTLSLLGLALAFTTPACTGDSDPSTETTAAVQATGPITVAVSSFPAAYLVTRLGGAHVDLNNVLPRGEDAPFWNPSGDTVARVQDAELIVASGAGFEKWMQTATLPSEKVVDSAAGVDLIRLEGETHSHGKKGEHSHAGVDPHTWSDPLTYLQQAQVVHAALVQARPNQEATFTGNLAALKDDLESLDRALKDATAPGKGVQLAANHPAFNYLARRYDLTIDAFDYDPEEVPSEDAKTAFTDWGATVERPHHLLWESTPVDTVRRSFPAGTIHVYIDPLEQPPEGLSYDYLAQAKKNVVTFQTIFRKQSTPSPAPPEGSP